jgi:hypothetical protein
VCRSSLPACLSHWRSQFRVRIIFRTPYLLLFSCIPFGWSVLFVHWGCYTMSNFGRDNNGYELHRSVLSDISCLKLVHFFDLCLVSSARGFIYDMFGLVGTWHAIIILLNHRFVITFCVLTWPGENDRGLPFVVYIQLMLLSLGSYTYAELILSLICDTSVLLFLWCLMLLYSLKSYIMLLS